MYNIPQDLVPLPTMPYSVRPDALPLSVEEARTAIWRAKGNITEAAMILKVDSSRLRRYVRNSPRLSAEIEEAKNQILDKAESIVVEALNDTEDAQRRDSMAKFALTNLGSDRGYGQKGGRNLNINNTGSGKVVVVWGDGSSFEDVDDADDGSDAQVIDHE